MSKYNQEVTVGKQSKRIVKLIVDREKTMKVFQLIMAAALVVSATADGHMEGGDGEEPEEPCDDEYEPTPSSKSAKKGGKNGKSSKTGSGSKSGKGVGKGGKTGGSKSSKYPDGGHPALYVMTNASHGNAVQMYCR